MSSTPPRPDDADPQPPSQSVLVRFTPAHRPASTHPPHAGISTRTPLQPEKNQVPALEGHAAQEPLQGEDLITFTPAPAKPSDANLIRFTPATGVSAPDANLIRFTPACAPPLPLSRTSETWAVPETPLLGKERRGRAMASQSQVGTPMYSDTSSDKCGVFCGNRFCIVQ